MPSVRFLLSTFLLLVGYHGLEAFQNSVITPPSRSHRHGMASKGRFTPVTGPKMTATARSYREEKPHHFLLEEFCIHTGEIVDPYRTLKVSRDADRSEVRKAYIALSKRYHPDGLRHREILPGKCNNLDDVREEWERIKLSYEILRDKKTRQRYDRHSMLANPGAAMSRAAFGAVGKGISGLGAGLFSVGAFAVRQITKEQTVDDSK